MSIITDPLVLYLDEPTSGLDSFTSDEVMTFVNKLSRDGMTICATIHSPSPFTFQLFRKLLLLIGGRIVYSGENGTPCVKYFINSGEAAFCSTNINLMSLQCTRFDCRPLFAAQG